MQPRNFLSHHPTSGQVRGNKIFQSSVLFLLNRTVSEISYLVFGYGSYSSFPNIVPVVDVRVNHFTHASFQEGY